jgi:hypothetical protein
MDETQYPSRRNAIESQDSVGSCDSPSVKSQGREYGQENHTQKPPSCMEYGMCSPEWELVVSYPTNYHQDS